MDYLFSAIKNNLLISETIKIVLERLYSTWFFILLMSVLFKMYLASFSPEGNLECYSNLERMNQFFSYMTFYFAFNVCLFLFSVSIKFSLK